MTAPVIGFSHVQLLVRDVAASETWYSTVLGMERLAAAEDESYVALRNRGARIVVVLTRGEPEGGGGLDHLAFAVPDGPSLSAWASELAGSGIAAGEVVDELGRPSLTLLDPDGNRVELVAPPGTW